MECACIDMCIDDGPAFTETETRTARKPHKCCSCRRVIQPGEKYEHTSGMWDGYFGRYKMCSDCLSIRETFFCGGWYYETILEDFKEHIRDCRGNINFSLIPKLTPAAQAIALDSIETAWADHWPVEE